MSPVSIKTTYWFQKRDRSVREKKKKTRLLPSKLHPFLWRLLCWDRSKVAAIFDALKQDIENYAIDKHGRLLRHVFQMYSVRVGERGKAGVNYNSRDTIYF